MLKQMFAEDRNDSVRATVIKSLALVMTIVESATKYKEVLLNTVEGGYGDYCFGRKGGGIAITPYPNIQLILATLIVRVPVEY